MQNQERKPKLKIGALWFKKSKAGNDYTSGLISRKALIEVLEKTTDENINILLVSNRKTQDRQPDMNVLCTDVDLVRSDSYQPGQRSNDEIPF